MTWGKKQESVVLEAFGEETGREVQADPQWSLRQSTEHPVLQATLDAQMMVGGQPGVVEVKVTRHGEEVLEDQSPLLRAWKVQVQHQLAVTGYELGSLAVLCRGTDFRWLDVPRNDYFIDFLTRRLEQMWEYVVKKELPDADGSEATAAAMARVFAHDDGCEVALGLEEEARFNAWLEAKEAKRMAEEAMRATENHLRRAMGFAAKGVLPGGRVLTLKTTTVEAYTKEVKAYTFRTLRVQKEKS